MASERALAIWRRAGSHPFYEGVALNSLGQALLGLGDPAEYRKLMNSPAYLANLEQLCMRIPNAKERLAATRERFRAMAAARAAAAEPARV